MPVKIAPSLLSADFLHLEESCRLVNDTADIYHLDIMDGNLVPNISYGFPVVQAMASVATKPLDVHLMIVSPDKYFERWAAIKGVEMISFHYEAYKEDYERIAALTAIRSLGIKAGIAFNPNIPIQSIFPLLHHADFALCMSVFAGFGGQKFIEDSYERIAALRDYIAANSLDVEIEVDGGVGEKNAPELVSSGANILVAGSAIFGSSDPAATVAAMRG